MSLRLVRVTGLYVGCSYPMRPDAIAASDTCQHPADTAVLDDGRMWWRCPLHQGLLRGGGLGEAVITHIRRDIA